MVESMVPNVLVIGPLTLHTTLGSMHLYMDFAAYCAVLKMVSSLLSPPPLAPPQLGELQEPQLFRVHPSHQQQPTLQRQMLDPREVEVEVEAMEGEEEEDNRVGQELLHKLYKMRKRFWDEVGPPCPDPSLHVCLRKVFVCHKIV